MPGDLNSAPRILRTVEEPLPNRLSGGPGLTPALTTAIPGPGGYPGGEALPGGVASRRLSPWLRALRGHAGLVAALVYLVGILAASHFAPLPYSPQNPNPAAILQAPSGSHWLGTDENGIDVLSRLVAAAQNDLVLAILGAVLATVVGTPIGLLASRENLLSAAVMRLLDVLQSIPLLVVALTIVALSGGASTNIVIAIGLINIPQFIRVTRAQALTLRSRRFIEAAEAMGGSERWVVTRHLLPNVMPVTMAQFSLSSGYALLAITALGYLGIGIEPTSPSWGAMLNDGSQFISSGQWWMLVFPGLAIALAILSFNALAHGILKIVGRTQVV